MKLWTVQPVAVYEELKKQGILHTDISLKPLIRPSGRRGVPPAPEGIWVACRAHGRKDREAGGCIVPLVGLAHKERKACEAGLTGSRVRAKGREIGMPGAAGCPSGHRPQSPLESCRFPLLRRIFDFCCRILFYHQSPSSTRVFSSIFQPSPAHLPAAYNFPAALHTNPKQKTTLWRPLWSLHFCAPLSSICSSSRVSA